MNEDQTNRQIETAANIARLQVTVEGIEGTIERIDGKLTNVVERIETAVVGHGFAIQQLQAAEARRTKARTAVVKWVAGVVASVAVGVIMFLVKR